MGKSKEQVTINRIEILKLITLIRESFDDSVKVYTQGSCVRFALILKHIYPQGEILWDESHALFELDGFCYDVTGDVQPSTHHIPIQDYGLLKLYGLFKLKYSE